MRSATRWATTPRLRPVRETSSALDRDRACRISSRIETSASSDSPPTSNGFSRFTALDHTRLARSFALRFEVRSSSVPPDRSLHRSRVAAGVRPASEIGAAVIGGGFIGTVHVEALRRLGVRVHGVLASSRNGRTFARGSSASNGATAASRRSTTIIEIVHVTSPNHLTTPRAAHPRGRPPRRVREAPGHDRRGVRRPRLACGEQRQVNAVNFNIRAQPARPRVRRGG